MRPVIAPAAIFAPKIPIPHPLVASAGQTPTAYLSHDRLDQRRVGEQVLAATMLTRSAQLLIARMTRGREIAAGVAPRPPVPIPSGLVPVARWCLVQSTALESLRSTNVGVWGMTPDSQAAIITNDLDSLVHRIEALPAHPAYTSALMAVMDARDAIRRGQADLHQRVLRERYATVSAA